jgi:hypothetical protein
MIYISHRGNLNGLNSQLENSPVYIDAAIDKRFYVEVDLWYDGNRLTLGHDEPQYNIHIDWLMTRTQYLFIHCKDQKSLDLCLRNNLNCFFHANDDYTLTSRGYTWCYPGQEAAGLLSIAVMPEKVMDIKTFKNSGKKYFGVCSDYVEMLNT